MANRFYTPTPMINFVYEPNPSDAQRLLDTMKIIKKENREDEMYELKKRQAEMAYKEGMLQLNAAQMKLDEIEHEKELDMEAGQVYNSILASNGTRRDALKAVGDLILRKGGYKMYEQHIKDANDTILEMAKLLGKSPEAANFIADIVSSTTGKDVTGDEVLRGWNADRYVPNANGERFYLDEDGNWRSENVLSPYMKELKKKEIELEERRVAAQERDIENALIIARLNSEAAAAKAQSNLEKLEREIEGRKEIKSMEIAGRKEIKGMEIGSKEKMASNRLIFDYDKLRAGIANSTADRELKAKHLEFLEKLKTREQDFTEKYKTDVLNLNKEKEKFAQEYKTSDSARKKEEAAKKWEHANKKLELARDEYELNVKKHAAQVEQFNLSFAEKRRQFDESLADKKEARIATKNADGKKANISRREAESLQVLDRAVHKLQDMKTRGENNSLASLLSEYLPRQQIESLTPEEQKEEAKSRIAVQEEYVKRLLDAYGEEYGTDNSNYRLYRKVLYPQENKLRNLLKKAKGQ